MFIELLSQVVNSPVFPVEEYVNRFKSLYIQVHATFYDSLHHTVPDHGILKIISRVTEDQFLEPVDILFPEKGIPDFVGAILAACIKRQRFHLESPAASPEDLCPSVDMKDTFPGKIKIFQAEGAFPILVKIHWLVITIPRDAIQSLNIDTSIVIP